MTYRPKVYTASKIKHRDFWYSLRHQWDDVEFTARWIDQPPGPDHDSTFWTELQKQHHWIFDIQDVHRSDCLIVYRGDEKERLVGTYVEVGVALALGKIVYASGFTGQDSWQAHPLVLVVPSIHEALRLITGRIP